MSDEEQKEEDFVGLMLGVVTFNGEPGVGIRLGTGPTVVFGFEYMVSVFYQLEDILGEAGCFDDENEEGGDEDEGEGRMLN